MTSISTTVNFNLALGRSIQQCISEIGADAPLRMFHTVIPLIPRFIFVGWAGGGGFRNLELVKNARGFVSPGLLHPFLELVFDHYQGVTVSQSVLSGCSVGWVMLLAAVQAPSCCPPRHVVPGKWEAPTSNPASDFQWLPYTALEVRFFSCGHPSAPSMTGVHCDWCCSKVICKFSS